jgi:DNA-binding GntR family transcriptional regulator
VPGWRPTRSSSGPPEAPLSSHQAFHRQLIEPAVHGIGRRVLDQLATVAERYVRLSVASLNADVLSAHDHDTLLEAFVAQDARLAEQETVHHLELESTIVEALTDLR